jgi:rhamnose transport system ATP-binding protein
MPTPLPDRTRSLKAGVTAIHQETVLFDELSVAENIFSATRRAIASA